MMIPMKRMTILRKIPMVTMMLMIRMMTVAMKMMWISTIMKIIFTLMGAAWKNLTLDKGT